MQNRDVSLILGKSRKRAPQISLRSVVLVRRLEPCGVIEEFSVTLTRFLIVQNGITHRREKVRPYVENIAHLSGLKKFQKDLMDRVLGPASFSCDRACE